MHHIDTLGFCVGTAVLTLLFPVAGCSSESPRAESRATGGSTGNETGGSNDVLNGSSGGVTTSSGGDMTTSSGGDMTTSSGGDMTTSSGGDMTTGSGGDMTTGSGGSADNATDAGAACTITDDAALCSTKPIVSITNGTDTRRVYWNTPTSAPPTGGWPAVVLYQGSIYGPSLSWNVSLPKSTMFGGYYQVALIARLLDTGFVVIQPEAQNGIAWNTNAGANYDTTPDAVFIPELLSEMSSGKFGPIDSKRLYATGISSGGYMTSRMAVSYAGRFKALAIESASYATCLGPICTIPPTLPADHPPTLFLHGDADNIVPIATAKAYFTALQSAGIETKFVEDPTAGHQWLAVAPSDVAAWFLAH